MKLVGEYVSQHTDLKAASLRFLWFFQRTLQGGYTVTICKVPDSFNCTFEKVNDFSPIVVVFPVYLRNEERAFVDALHSILAHLYQRSIRPNRNVLWSCFNLILPSLHPLDKQASLVFSTEKFFSHNRDADLWNEILCFPDHHPICHISYSKCLCLPFLLFPAEANPCTNNHHEGVQIWNNSGVPLELLSPSFQEKKMKQEMSHSDITVHFTYQEREKYQVSCASCHKGILLSVRYMD